MSRHLITDKICARRLCILVCALSALLASGCAAGARPDAAGPRSNEPPYPILMKAETDRRDAALAAWNALAREQGVPNAPAPELQPTTATVRSLPALSGASLYLPKVGAGAMKDEEETRESLRRFNTSAQRLIGATPQQLSLLQRTELADGNKRATYRQRPFRLPLRGGYGLVEINFAPDRRVLQLTSTAIPDIEELQRAATGVRPHNTADAVPKLLLGKTVTYTDTNGNQHSLAASAPADINVSQLVIYPRPRAADPTTLEFHLAWEVFVKDEAAVYLDAVTDEMLAATSIPAWLRQSTK